MDLQHLDPQLLGSFLTGLLGLIGSIVAVLKQQAAKKETNEVRSSVQEMIATYESTAKELRAQIAEASSEREAMRRQLNTLREDVIKSEAENTRLRIEAMALQSEVTKLRTDAQTLSTTNERLLDRVRELKDDLEETTLVLREKKMTGLL